MAVDLALFGMSQAIIRLKLCLSIRLLFGFCAYFAARVSSTAAVAIPEEPQRLGACAGGRVVGPLPDRAAAPADSDSDHQIAAPSGCGLRVTRPPDTAG